MLHLSLTNLTTDQLLKQQLKTKAIQKSLTLGRKKILDSRQETEKQKKVRQKGAKFHSDDTHTTESKKMPTLRLYAKVGWPA